jgi:hypothetical protein
MSRVEERGRAEKSQLILRAWESCQFLTKKCNVKSHPGALSLLICSPVKVKLTCCDRRSVELADSTEVDEEITRRCIIDKYLDTLRHAIVFVLSGRKGIP